MFTAEELTDIKWLAGLVKAQALSERNAANRLYGAYNDRDFVHSDLAMARSKIARCEAVLEAVERVVNGCTRAYDADAMSVGLDWCRRHDARWDLSNKACDKGEKE